MQRTISTMLVALAMLLGLNTVPAAADSAPACVRELANEKLSQKLTDLDRGKPVVLFGHGLFGDADVWRSTDMRKAVESIDNVQTYSFNYQGSNISWIEGETARVYAKTIVCLYKITGEPVIPVDHSMGGLLTRAGLGWAADGMFAKDAVEHVITIGTPHKGALSANAVTAAWQHMCEAPAGWLRLEFAVRDRCRDFMSGYAFSGLSINSDQLADLPRFPDDITVKAIAGRAYWQACGIAGCAPKLDTGGDLVVAVDSATDQYTQTGNGDGMRVFECTTDLPVAQISPADCEHSNLLSNSDVQAEVKTSIRQYLDYSAKPAYAGWATGAGMKLPLLDGWNAKQSGADRLHVIDTDTCVDTGEGDYWKACAGLSVYEATPDGLIWNDRDALLESWATGCPNPAIRKNGREWMMGGERAEFYELPACDAFETPSTSYMWWVPGRALIHHVASSEGQLMILDEVLRDATWN